jgi:serine/threonine protein kinase
MVVAVDDVVDKFVKMLMPIIRTSTGDVVNTFKTNLLTVLQMRTITNIAREDSYQQFLKETYNAIEVYEGDVMTATGKKGTYGELFSVAGKATIIKRINFFQGTDITSFRNFFANLKELFIQYVLASDPVIGKHVPQLMSVKRIGTHTLLVEMERADYTLSDWLKDVIARTGVLSFDVVRPRFKQILAILSQFHEKYKFAHRDFKMDNVMFSGVGPTAIVKFIDFGMSCVEVEFAGKTCKIINDVYYATTSTCKPEQDIGLFLLTFMVQFGEYLDIDLQEFLKDSHAANFKQHLEGLQSQLRLEHRAYNKNGSLFSTEPVQSFFKPAEIMRLLGVLRLTVPKSIAASRNQSRRVNATRHLPSRRSTRIRERSKYLTTLTRKGTNKTRKNK